MSLPKKRSRLRRILEEFTVFLMVEWEEFDPNINNPTEEFMRRKGLTEVGPYTEAEAKRVTEILHEYHLLHSCVTCTKFDSKLEFCRMAKQRPPAQVIAQGCPAWEALPF